jgi:hypothetical protein
MKKAIVGVAAVGAVIALRPALKRRLLQKMHGHCQQMAPTCRQMMAGQPTERGEAAGTRQPSEQEAPQFVGSGEAVGTT